MTLPRTKLVKKEKAAEATMLFQFEKPEGFTYKAGQFADYTLLDPPATDAEGNTRGFTLASAPYESNLMCTTRMRDTAFKRVLKDMPLGTEVELDAPYGSFTLHNNVSRPAVFLTGGIGITPVRSIIMESVHDKTGHTIIVFYSNKRAEDAAFLDELGRIASAQESITIVATMTEPANTRHGWTVEMGYITQEMLARHLKDVTVPIYYLCGPAGMVAAMRMLLNATGVDDDDTRTEDFTGY